jgi:DNA-binding transcriptional LysR family regulator
MISPSVLLRRLDLTTLQLFVAIAEESTLTRAAERENIAPSAASRRLTELEEDLGIELFVRQPKGMRTTPAGDILLVHARRMLSAATTIGVELSEYSQGVRGHIRVLANLSAIVAYLPEDLEAFFKLHRDLRVELEERPSDRVVRGVHEGWAEIGICSRDADLMGLQAERYRRDELGIIMRNDHPLAVNRAISYADTLEFDQISLHVESSIFTRSRMAAREAARPLKPRIHVPGFDAICRTVQANLGIAIIPKQVFDILGRPMNLHFEHLTDEWAARELVVITRDHEHLGGPARSLREHLLKAP